MTYWLSFAGFNGFIGVIVVDDADDIEEAIRLVNAAKLNPGGEVCGFGFNLVDLPEDVRQLMDKTPRYQLLGRSELKRIGHDALEDEQLTEMLSDSRTEHICLECNPNNRNDG